MTTIHTLGYPRIGADRELKKALEGYWRGDLNRAALESAARAIRLAGWQAQREAGLDFVSVGDFSLYDHVLDTSAMLGAVPPRFGWQGETVDIDTLFRMARGRAPSGAPAPACEMTKWFDTNYHHIVPELHADMAFRLASSRLFDAVAEARAEGHRVKPVLLGPLTWLWLGKCRDGEFDRLALLDRLLPVYGEILQRLAAQGVEWVQIDEPILVLDLPREWRAAFEAAYSRLSGAGPKTLLCTYFGGLGDNLHLACHLPVDGLHVDLVRAPAQLDVVLDKLPAWKVLSLGILDGRNVWRADPDPLLARLRPVAGRLGDRLWLAPSCSLLHVPQDLGRETGLDAELRNWLAFARQKLDELRILRTALDAGEAAVAAELTAARAAANGRRHSARIHRPAVAERLAAVTPAMASRRSPFAVRHARQQAWLKLPPLPTTTIGSFPQTAAIRATRRDWRRGQLDDATYRRRMQAEIADVIRRQEALGLDVLVHGEPERNDMVEYFGEQLGGFAITEHGWVQSYGSRCVKPPILYGDVFRPAAMTVDWIRHAQSLTERPVKGMLTGPVTILNWSFVRDDQPRRETARQIALALRDEVQDLEAAGIRVIQIDEAALREGLPLRRGEWQAYLDWAVNAFRLTAGGVDDGTQIHTHMCYADFHDILPAIAAMDADVITIETARSHMELLEAFRDFDYPNAIGPGVYDIHSPNVPTVEEIHALLRRAAERIPLERLWVNPDCGLKTRDWPEVEAALAAMVAAARRMREVQISGAA